MQRVIDIALAFWATLSEMAPWLIGGFLFAGVLSVFFKASQVQRHLGPGSRGGVWKAAVFGVPLPLCSCGVIPVSAGLYRQGASRGATSSFLLTTPQTGVDSIFATYAVMGPVYAVVRPVVALVNGLLGGYLIDGLDRRDAAKAEAAAENADAVAVSLPMAGGCCGGGKETGADAVGESLAPEAGSCCGGAGETAGNDSGWAKTKAVLRYGLVMLPADIAGSLLLGLSVAALLTALVPADALTPYLGGGLSAMLVAVVVGIPLYVCATGSIPIGLGLIAAGASPGAVLAFLIAGPATNAATVSVTWNLLGRRTGILYLVSVAVTAIGAGLLLDQFFPTLESLRLPESALEPHHMGLDWVDHLWAGALMALLVPALWKRFGPRGSAPAASSQSSADVETAAVDSVNQDQPGVVQQRLEILGMTCGGCTSSAERSLRAVTGVESVDVSLDAGGVGQASVVGRSLTRPALVRAVEQAGFRVVDDESKTRRADRTPVLQSAP